MLGVPCNGKKALSGHSEREGGLQNERLGVDRLVAG